MNSRRRWTTPGYTATGWQRLIAHERREKRSCNRSTRRSSAQTPQERHAGHHARANSTQGRAKSVNYPLGGGYSIGEPELNYPCGRRPACTGSCGLACYGWLAMAGLLWLACYGSLAMARLLWLACYGWGLGSVHAFRRSAQAEQAPSPCLSPPCGSKRRAAAKLSKARLDRQTGQSWLEKIFYCQSTMNIPGDRLRQ